MTRRSSRALLGPLLLAFTLAPLGTAAAATEASLTGYDLLTPPGRTVSLRAKLERKGVMGINPDVKGESLDYFLVTRDGEDLDPAKYLGSGRTDGNGFATIEWPVEAPGQYLVEARIRRGSDYVALPARIRVAAPPADRSIVLVQLDETVSKATNLKMFRGTANEKIEVVEGAREILQLLSTPHQLVYLTDLEVAFTSKFKDWLQLRDLPPAPVIFWELFARSLSHDTYMQKLVGRLRQDFPQLEVGIAGRASDGATFVEHGLAGIVLTEDPEELDPAAIFAANWRHVLHHMTQLERTELLLKQLAGDEPEEQRGALAQLSTLGPEGVGYVHRFRRAADLDLAAAATRVAGTLRAIEAFAGALDLSTANAALRSLLAAWRHGEPAVVATLHRDREAALKQPVPQFTRAEMVSRTEPEPGKVVFGVRLIGEETSERQLPFVYDEATKRWKVQAE